MDGLVTEDWSFTNRPRPRVRMPLRDRDDARNILFSAGVGLGLGDQYMCLPLVRRLLRHFPHGHVTILTDYPDFWAMESLPQCRVLARTRSDSGGVLEEVRRPYDLAIIGYHPGCLEQLEAAPCPVVFSAGRSLASYRAFFADHGLCSEVSLNCLHSVWAESERFEALFDDFGISRRDTSVVHLRPHRAIYSGPVRVLIHPGSAKPHKLWSLERWRALADLLVNDGFALTVSSGVNDEERRMAKALGETDVRVDVLDSAVLRDFVDIVRRQHVVLSGDTFLAHAVARMRCPTALTLYGPTDPLRFCPRTLCNFYISPLSVSPECVSSCLRTLVALLRGNVMEVAAYENVHGLIEAAEALVHAVSKPGRFGAPEWREWHLAYETFRARIMPAHQPLLTGILPDPCAVPSSVPTSVWLEGHSAVRAACKILASHHQVRTDGEVDVKVRSA